MREMIFLGSIAVVYVPVILSPGPNFLVLTRLAISDSRRTGLFAAFGVTSASVLLSTLAIMGAGLLLAQSPLVSNLLPLVGGTYLVYVGWRTLWRSSVAAQSTIADRQRKKPLAAYRDGLMTNLTNPQSLIFFSSIFASLLTKDLPTWTRPAGVLLIAAISIAANIATVVAFSIPRMQAAYLNAKTTIDRIAGILLVLYGLRIALARLV